MPNKAPESQSRLQRYLFIIDVQTAFFEGRERVPQPEMIISNLKSVLERARSATSPPIKVIWVRHNELEEPSSDFKLGTRLWEIHDSLVPHDDGSEPIIDKTKPSAFEGTNLFSYLPPPDPAVADQDVDTETGHKNNLEFIVTGMQSDCCVVATAQDLLKFYPTAKTIVVRGAHWTFDYYNDDGNLKMSAKQVADAIDDTLEKKGAVIVDLEESTF